jgi:chaperonin GroES
MSDKHKPGTVSYQPLADKIIVDVDPTVTEQGGVKIPEAAQKRPNTGKVVAVGPGVVINGTLCPPSVKVGDRICMFPVAGYPITHEGKEHIIIKEHEILAVER